MKIDFNDYMDIRDTTLYLYVGIWAKLTSSQDIAISWNQGILIIPLLKLKSNINHNSVRKKIKPKTYLVIIPGL